MVLTQATRISHFWTSLAVLADPAASGFQPGAQGVNDGVPIPRRQTLEQSHIMLAQPRVVTLAYAPGMRSLVAGDIALHDPAAIRRGLAAQTLAPTGTAAKSSSRKSGRCQIAA